MRRTLLTFILISLINFLFAGTKTNGTPVTAQFEGSTTFFQFRQGEEIPFSGLNKWMYATFHTDEKFSLALLDVNTDELGITTYRYIQNWNGLPVQGTMWLVHVKAGKIISCNGMIYPSLSCPVTVSLSEPASLSFALSYMNAELYQWQDKFFETQLKTEEENPIATYYPKGELWFAPAEGNYESNQYRLCWRFDVYAQKPLKRQYVYIDAVTGKVIYTLDRIWDADIQGTAVTVYLGNKTITTDSYNGSYRLRESGRGGGIETYNMKTGTSYTNSVDFTDTDNFWNNVNAAKDQYAVDAHYGTEMTYDYYKNKHNRNSVNNAGMKLRSYLHYSTNYVNAFWDGSRMTYGDGDATYKPLTAIDITGHEISHGVTQYTCNLNYSNEPGALNEGFSDCMGTAVEFYGAGNKADWLIAEDIGEAFRSLSNPKAYRQPNTYKGTYWYTGSADNGGVHTNSGVINYWFYLVSSGGKGTNDKGAAYNITGISMDKAAKILYRAWSVYMTSTSQYADARQYTIQAAIDLYGACTPEVETVTNAWYAVGIGNIYNTVVTANFTAATVTACTAPATFQFQNLSSNGSSFKWYFGDNLTAVTANPTHVYMDTGRYTVKLVVTGGCGSDSVTKTAFVIVSPAIPCAVQLPSGGAGMTQTTCTGTLYDNGGPNGNYKDNTDCRITISPPNANGLKLTFNAFKLEDQFDFLYIYDGPDTNSNLIGRYTGIEFPNGGIVYTTGSSATIRMITDPAADSLGFAMTWQCLKVPPSANFTSDFDHSCSGKISFRDLSSFSPDKWEWDFGDGTTSSQQNPSHTYNKNGTYSVKLVAYNSLGKDSVRKVDYISITRPAVPSVTNATSCSSPASVTLSATGAGTLNWYDKTSGGNLVNTGTTYTTPQLSTSKTYYVESVQQDSPQSGGKPSNSGSGGKFDNGLANRFIYFDVFQSVKLVSMDVYAYGSAYRTIEWRNSSGAPIKDTTVYLTGGSSTAIKSTVTLNWDLVPGTGYQMAIKGESNLFRNSSGATYPYVTPGYLSITGSNAGSDNTGYYYYFYNWKLQPYACVSRRVAVTAYVGGANAAITPSGVVSVCPGNTVTLTATGGGNAYKWSNGETTQSIQISEPGEYTVTESNSGSCSDTSEAVTIRQTNPPVAAFDYINSGTDAIFNNTSIGASTYTWDFGDGSLIETTENPTHSYFDNKPYNVTLTACNEGCCDTISQMIRLSTGINNLQAKNAVVVFPNPFSDKIFVRFSDASNNVSIKLINLLGQDVPSAIKQNSEKDYELNTGTVATGVYYLIYRSETTTETVKVIKVKE